jgi:hypothetical protein
MDINRLIDLPKTPGIMGLDKYVQAGVLIPLIEMDHKTPCAAHGIWNHLGYHRRDTL